MKKLFAMLLALVLLMSAAYAEEPAAVRTRAIALESDPLQAEPETFEVVETEFAGEGYTLWYQADVLEAGLLYNKACFRPVGAAEEEAGTSYLIVPTEIAAENAEDMMTEATGGYDAEWAVGEVRELTGDMGGRILSVDAVGSAEVHRYYLVPGEELSLCITAIFPLEEAEATGLCFDLMTMTIGF